jgi:predicted dehydrogenase
MEAGKIVDYGHLPAYEKAGLKITGVYDIERDKAADVAERHGLVTCSSMLNI